MLDTVCSPADYADWQRFAVVEPFGEVAANNRASLIAWAQFQSQTRRKLKLEDFALKYEPAKRANSIAEFREARLAAMQAVSKGHPPVS